MDRDCNESAAAEADSIPTTAVSVRYESSLLLYLSSVHAPYIQEASADRLILQYEVPPALQHELATRTGHYLISSTSPVRTGLLWYLVECITPLPPRPPAGHLRPLAALGCTGHGIDITAQTNRKRPDTPAKKQCERCKETPRLATGQLRACDCLAPNKALHVAVCWGVCPACKCPLIGG